MTHNGKPEVVLVSISRPDGGVSIMQFVTRDAHGLVRQATSENIEAEIKKSGTPCTSWRIIDPSEVPRDRTHRDAWKTEGGRIVVDQDKAAAIDEKRKLDEAVKAALKAQRDALIDSVKASLK